MKQIAIIVIVLLGVDLRGLSQPISVDSIVAFYKNANIECYKEKINTGMKNFDKWLTDTFPHTTTLHSSYSPSDVDLQEYNAIPIVALHYYNMENFGEDEDIYNHLIIDSTKCIILIPLDEKNRPLGITDILGETYSYLSFRNKEDMRYYHSWSRYVNQFLKTCRKNVPNAFVYIDHGGLGYGGLGYVSEGKIMLVRYKQRHPVELRQFIRKWCNHSEALNMLRTSDYVCLSERNDEYFQKKEIRSGNTPKNLIRICLR